MTTRTRHAGARTLWLPLLACVAVLPALAQDNPLGRSQSTVPGAAGDRVVSTVYRGNYSFVRIERADNAASPNLQPFAIAPAALREALANLRNAAQKDRPLFNDDELAEIVPPLAKALAEARADQDVVFAVAGRHGGFGPLVPRSVTTGRVFRDAGGLQLILGLVQQPFESQFIGSGVLIPFEPGRRDAAVDRNVRVAAAAGSGTLRRPDWVALSLAPAAPAATAAPAAAPAAAGAAPTAATAARPAPPRARDAAFFEEQELRLRALKRLREGNLISEQEYEQKRREILEQL